MIFKTIYRFRVRVQEEHSISFPLHLCVYHNKFPLFRELVEKIQPLVKNVDDYHITIDKTRRDYGSRNVLHDDHTLRDALKSLSDQDRLEILLCRKHGRISSDTHRSDLQQKPIIPDNVPVIKPTVLRWNSAANALPPPLPQPRARVNSIQSFPDQTIRKDSGISFDGVEDDVDEPMIKKQRVMSADESMQTRKLPELSPHYHALNSPPPHPLDLHRHRVSSPAITLPALSSLSSPAAGPPSHTPQLAPIHPRFYSPSPTLSPQSSTLSLPPPPSSAPPSTPLSPAPSAAKRKSSRRQQRPTVALRSTQYLCEHVVDPVSGRLCGQTFRRSYDLSRHQTIHLKNRPFCYCHQCGKKFTRLDALRRHERVQGHDAENRRAEKVHHTHHAHHSHHHHNPTHHHHRTQQARV